MRSERIYSLQEAKLKIEAYCAYQDRCHSEVKSKLFSFGLNQEEVDTLMVDLIGNRFLDEERFAKSFVSGKFRIKNWGRIKIRQALKQKQVSDYCINKGFNEIDLDEYVLVIQKLVIRKSNELEAKEKDVFKRKMKIARFMASRGFESDLVFDAIEQINS